ncbi:MAG: carboxypeptidase-like regulatory domain-containing protein [Acidobacteriota bacterium]
MKRVVSVVGLLVAVMMVALAADPQKSKKDSEATVRSVQGVVEDADGKPVPGAVVHLKNNKTLQVRSFITKEDGTYAFHGLSTNVDYELKADHQNVSSDVKTLSVFDSRNTAVINLKLKK